MAYIKELKVTYTRKRVDDDLLNKPVQSPDHVYELFKFMQDETKEKVAILNLNPQLEILSYEIIAIGSSSKAVFEPSDVYRNAVLARASSILVMHNYPSGLSTPTDDDLAAAAHLHENLKLGRMPLQDFIIIGSSDFYSFRQQGHLQ